MPRYYPKYTEECPRCEAMVTVSLTGRRCKYPSVPGSNPPRCERHVAINEMEKGVGAQRRVPVDPRFTEAYMPRFYSRTLKPTLAARITDMLEETQPLEQLGITEELALMRDHAANAVAVYSAAVEAGSDPQALLTAGMMMSGALQEVVKVAKDAAAIEDTKAKLAGAFVHVMESVIVSVVRAAHEAFGDDYRVGIFEKNLREHLVIRLDRNGSGLGIDGTALTPDQDVMAMDDTVPREPRDESDADGDTTA